MSGMGVIGFIVILSLIVVGSLLCADIGKQTDEAARWIERTSDDEAETVQVQQ